MKTIGLIGCAVVSGFALGLTLLATAGRDVEPGPVREVTVGPGTLTPSPRAYHSMQKRGSTYMFGGTNGTRQLDETWKKRAQNRAWYLTELGGPEAREKAGLIFESTLGRLILFGGKGADGALYDTWEHRGGSARNKWTLISLTGPSARYGHAMTYDKDDDRVILFGGTNGTDVYRDTWEMVFQNGLPVWRQISNSGPPARHASAMVYDPVRRRALLFGGRSNATEGTLLGDTWELHDNHWTWIANSGPEPREDHQIVFHTSCSLPVLFGGTNGTDDLGDTWFLMRDKDWILVADTGPHPRRGHAMSYDCTQDHIVLNGGMNDNLLDDTWVMHIDCNTIATGETCHVDVDDFGWNLQGPTALRPTGSRSRSGSAEGSGESSSSSGESVSCASCDRTGNATREEHCHGDVNQSAVVDVHDLVGVFSAFGSVGGPADVDGDGSVGFSDIITVISAWGPCDKKR